MAADGSRLPSSNRGVSEFREPGETISVGIDWLACSVDLLAVLNEQGLSDDQKNTLDVLNGTGANAHEIAGIVFAHFLAGSGLSLGEQVGKGRFYLWRIPVNDDGGNYVGMIELGGGNTIRQDGTVTCRVELTGDGCRMYSAAGSGHAKRWLELRAKLESCAGRLTRVDVAADDLAGKFPVRMAMEWLADGEFDNRGQKVKRQLIDDFDSGDGKTLYIGSKKSEKFLRVYEKGRELGDASSEWVRYEAQFSASNRKELPLDMLRDPAAYLLGAYPVLRFIRAMAERIDVTKAAAISTLKSCRRHLRRQYGATLNFLCKNTDGDEMLANIVRTLTTNKLPSWASKTAANQWPEILAINHAKGATP